MTEMNEARIHAAYAARLTRNRYRIPDDDEYICALYEVGEMALSRKDYAVLRTVLLRIDGACIATDKEEMLA